MTTHRAPVIAISHGGGPMPLLGDPAHASIVSSLQTRVPKLLGLGTANAPRAIVLVTAHWSEERPTVSCGERHGLLYDYYGFPKESYEIRYDAQGSPGVAAEVQQCLAEEGLEPVMDDERGWDHGVFVPMKIINPSASIPIVQLSVLSSEDPAAHYRMGRALARLRDSNVAVIGSGFATFHNLRIFRTAGRDPAFLERNERWSEEVVGALGERDAGVRGERLGGWRGFEGSFEMHPRGGGGAFLAVGCLCGGGWGGEGGEL